MAYLTMETIALLGRIHHCTRQAAKPAKEPSVWLPHLHCPSGWPGSYSSRGETKKAAGDRVLDRSQNRPASRAGGGAFSDFQGNLKFLSESEA